MEKLEKNIKNQKCGKSYFTMFFKRPSDRSALACLKLYEINFIKNMNLGIDFYQQVLLRSNESGDSDYFGIFNGETLKLTIGLCPSEIGHK